MCQIPILYSSKARTNSKVFLFIETTACDKTRQTYKRKAIIQRASRLHETFLNEIMHPPWVDQCVCLWNHTRKTGSNTIATLSIFPKSTTMNFYKPETQLMLGLLGALFPQGTPELEVKPKPNERVALNIWFIMVRASNACKLFPNPILKYNLIRARSGSASSVQLFSYNI